MADELIRHTLDLASQFTQMTQPGGLVEQTEARLDTTIESYFGRIMPILRDPELGTRLGDRFVISDLRYSFPQNTRRSRIELVYYGPNITKGKPNVCIEMSGDGVLHSRPILTPRSFWAHAESVGVGYTHSLNFGTIYGVFPETNGKWNFSFWPSGSNKIYDGNGVIRTGRDDKTSYEDPRPVAMKPLELSDLLQNPQLFPRFVEGVNNLFSSRTEQELGKLNAREKAIGLRILKETAAASIPGATVNLPTDQPLTPAQVRGIVDQAIAANPRILRLEQEGASKGDLRELMTALMETTARDTRRSHDRQDLQQAYAILRQKAQGNPEAQQAVEAFIKNSPNLTDPERVLKVLVDIVGGFVPGAHGVITLVEALNDWLIA